MISQHIRRTALLIQHQQGGSLQDILQSMVMAAGGQIVQYHEAGACMFCGSAQILITSTRTATEFTTRSHRCGFCGATFQSREFRAVEVTAKQPGPLEVQPKKRHYKNRKR